MWLGEQVDEYGIGNGISIIIMAGIVARMPQAVMWLVENARLSFGAAGAEVGLSKIMFLVVGFVAVTTGVILITQGQRRIPIKHAKFVRGRRVFGGGMNYLPLRVNQGGVMPIIFASSLLMFPGIIFDQIARNWGNPFWTFMQDAFKFQSLIRTLCYVGLIFFFAYFWTTVQFRPQEIADNLQEQGASIRGRRPSRAAKYLEQVMERITYVGAAFLALIAIIPTVLVAVLELPYTVTAFLGGTGLLICVSVVLDLVGRVEASLKQHEYSGLLGKGGTLRGPYG
jgi:preprotein translocase subunit SecY